MPDPGQFVLALACTAVILAGMLAWVSRPPGKRR